MTFPAQGSGRLYPRQYPGPSLSMGVMGYTTGPVDQGAVNDLMICPYNESHVVSGGRYQRHLIRCRKAYGYTDDGKMIVKDADGNSIKVPAAIVQCPYNFSHHVHRSVLKKHVILCESYYKHQMYTQPDPPGYNDNDVGNRGARNVFESSTDTDSEEVHQIPKPLTPIADTDALDRELEKYLRMQDGVDELGSPLVIPSPVQTTDSSDADEWHSLSSQLPI